MKAYSGRTRYQRKYDEDLSNALQLYELTCTLCSLSDEQKRKGIMVMLDGSALDYYAANLKNLQSYEDVVKGLSDWFTSEQQKKRLLNQWNETKLSKLMTEDSENSQVGVF